MPSSKDNGGFSAIPALSWSHAATYAVAGATILSGATTYKLNDTTTIGGTPSPMEPARPTEGVMSYDERLIDAKLEAVEARTETKFAQLMGKMDSLTQTLSGVSANLVSLDSKVGELDKGARSAKSTVIATIIGAAIGIVGLSFAAVSIFQSGMGTTATAYQSGVAAAEAKKK